MARPGYLYRAARRNAAKADGTLVSWAAWKHANEFAEKLARDKERLKIERRRRKQKAAA